MPGRRTTLESCSRTFDARGAKHNRGKSSANMLRTLHTAYVQSKLEYGLPAFGPFLLHDIGHLQQHFLQENRVCGKAIKGEPHAADNSRSPR